MDRPCLRGRVEQSVDQRRRATQMITRMMVISIGSGGMAWLGWLAGRDAGVLAGFLAANVGFATGWYYSRKFVREHLDF